ncbi:MAG: DNA polymerase III subunit gamma/tau [Deltaproteobacteria bacterium]|nr:MAG: DNA polymerase III subunit gamma/tau [Deltaproteobacteria bacterium]
MSYLVLARKYRPQTFERVIGQEHVTRTLGNAIALDRVAHAVLFSGPRGTGKTTVARILAKALNCVKGPAPVPCNVCRSCNEIASGNAVDVFEIDGASNNSVEQVRELRENVKYMPAHSPYKIYIIDEVHMLSIAAFNALLKTLEEPPAHIQFIFATTEPHKIPITILSRCQRHDFKRIPLELIKRQMESICEKEEIDIDRQCLWLMAREAGGSMRDALSLLDQVMTCAKGRITYEDVLEILGIIDRKFIFDISNAVLSGEVAEFLDCLDTVYDRGHDMKKLYADLLEHFRNLLVIKIGKNVGKLIGFPSHEIELMLDQVKEISAAYLNQIFDLLFKEETTIKFSSNPKMALELAFIRLFQVKPALPIDLLVNKLDQLRQEIAGLPQKDTFATGTDEGSAENTAVSMRPENNQEQSEADSSHPRNTGSTASSPTSIAAYENPQQAWNRIYKIISERNPSLAANLTKASLKRLTGRRLEIEVNGNGFNVNMIKREKNLDAIKTVCREFFGKDMEIVISAKEIPANADQKKKSNDIDLKNEALSHPLVAEAVEIFNGQIVDVKIR